MSSVQPSICVPKRTHRVFPELTIVSQNSVKNQTLKKIRTLLFPELSFTEDLGGLHVMISAPMVLIDKPGQDLMQIR